MFDKDGTLLAFHALWSPWFDRVCEEIQRQKPRTAFDKFEVAKSIGLEQTRGLTDAKGPLAIGTMQDIAIFFSSHLYEQNLPWNEAVQTVRHSMEKVHEAINWKPYLQPLPGLEDFLARAGQSGVKMGVVTSDDTEMARTHLNLLNILDFFHVVMGSEQIERAKPFPDIGIQACRDMNIDPEQLVVIGDTNGDMNLGKNLKAKASIGVVTYTGEDTSHLTDADHIIRHYGELSIDE